MRCKPGDLCIVIGESPDCACNIGAMLTVTKFSPTYGGWEFKDASRPLKLTGEDVFVTESYYIDFTVAYMYDHHLMPIPKDKVEDDTIEEIEKEVE